MILVDTSVWSRAYRRRAHDADDPVARHLRSLITAGEPVAMPGIVLQELLSGVRASGERARLERVLAPFPLVLADRADHVRAARIRDACRTIGVATSSIDALIAAQAVERGAGLFAADEDFARMARCCPLRLVEGPKRK